MTEATKRPPEAVKPKLDPTLKFALELGPLGLFFLTFWKFGIFVATAVLMVAVLVTLVVSYIKLRRLPLMPMVTAVIVLVFGGMGLIFHNDTFIKVKPTVLYCLFSAALFFGLAFRRPMLEIMFDGALHLTAAGWRILTWRWAFFFLFLAVLNEYVWRHYSESAWVAFKTFGFLPLTVVFALAQTPVLIKHESKEAPEEEAI
ncbi:MAG TPA: septation protein A [Roseiarcus sp.]|nr:septation protein A [Roseiarcus sp.]